MGLFRDGRRGWASYFQHHTTLYVARCLLNGLTFQFVSFIMLAHQYPVPHKLLHYHIPNKKRLTITSLFSIMLTLSQHTNTRGTHEHNLPLYKTRSQNHPTNKHRSSLCSNTTRSYHMVGKPRRRYLPQRTTQIRCANRCRSTRSKHHLTPCNHCITPCQHHAFTIKTPCPHHAIIV